MACGFPMMVLERAYMPRLLFPHGRCPGGTAAPVTVLPVGEGPQRARRRPVSDRLGDPQVMQDEVELGHVGEHDAHRAAELLAHGRRDPRGAGHVLAAVVAGG